MLANLAKDLNIFISLAKQHLSLVFIILGGLWGINIINWLIGSRLNVLGLYPRNLFGLVGIVFSPILHKNFNHLFFNSIPLFGLSIFIMTLGKNIFLDVTITIALLSGLAVWLFGRRAIHIGASGIISGYFGFLLGVAYQHPSITTIFLAGLTLYYFGSIFLGIFPSEERVSWEGHLFGFLSGIAAIYIF